MSAKGHLLNDVTYLGLGAINKLGNNKKEKHTAMVAEWFERVSNSSRQSLEGPEFESC